MPPALTINTSVFRIILAANSYYFPERKNPDNLCNDEVFSLRYGLNLI